MPCLSPTPRRRGWPDDTSSHPTGGGRIRRMVAWEQSPQHVMHDTLLSLPSYQCDACQHRLLLSAPLSAPCDPCIFSLHRPCARSPCYAVRNTSSSDVASSSPTPQVS